MKPKSLCVTLILLLSAFCFADCPNEYEFVLLNSISVDGNAEIISWQPGYGILAATNCFKKRVDFYRWNEAKPSQIISNTPAFSVKTDGEPTSVSISPDSNLALVTVLNDNHAAIGKVIIIRIDNDTQGQIIAEVPVGIGPDNICLGHLGKLAMVANEAEQNNKTSGSIGTIYINDSNHVSVRYNQLAGLADILDVPEGVIEPEYCAMSNKDEVAIISCQENDALLLIDLRGKEPVCAAAIKLKDASGPDGVAVIDWYDSIKQKQGWLVAAACEGRKQSDGSRSGQCADFFFIWSDENKLQWTQLASISLLNLFDSKRIDPEGIDIVSYDDKAAVFVGCERTDAVVCIMMNKNREHHIAGIVKVGHRPEGIKAGLCGDDLIVVSGNEGTDESNSSISICKLRKNTK